jgi:hypothetical protein
MAGRQINRAAITREDIDYLRLIEGETIRVRRRGIVEYLFERNGSKDYWGIYGVLDGSGLTYEAGEVFCG